MIRRLTLLMMALAAPALADGVIDIRPTGAALYTISASGSYRLVDDIAMTANVTCITINASNVILDLNGHTIDANGVAIGTAHGLTSVAGINNVTVRNGIIRGFGGMGFAFPNVNAGTIERVTVENCAVVSNGAAIDLGANGAVLGCVVRNNASTTGPIRGIRITTAGRVEGNRVVGNTSTTSSATGIEVSSGCTVADNVCNGNVALGGSFAASGIVAGAESTIVNNTCTGNNNLGTGEARGISAGANCMIEGNVAKGNNATAAASYGIVATTETVVRGNNASNNVTSGNGSGVGISVGSGCMVESNVCAGNREGTGNADSVGILVSGQGGRIANNTCRGNSATGSNGSAYGISVNATSYTIVGNDCTSNVATGTGVSAGIVVFPANCRVLSNECTAHTGGSGSYGIYIQNTDCFIADNVTGANGTAGIHLLSTTGGNMVQTNRTTDTTSIINGAIPPTLNNLPTGDLANVAF